MEFIGTPLGLLFTNYITFPVGLLLVIAPLSKWLSSKYLPASLFLVLIGFVYNFIPV
jgi:hypothetical protein